MTASQIARQLHGVKAGRRWSCRCPVSRNHAHGDRSRSLSVWEAEDGWVILKCFAGCSRDEILAAAGLQVRDLALKAFTRNPEWEQMQRDRERLAKLERRNGLALMAKVVIPGERNYWAAVERNTSAEIEKLRTKMYPDDAAAKLRNQTTQHLIREFGFDELWSVLP